MIRKVRWHGRGGAGVVTAANLLGSAAALYENLYVQSFPAFGPERRGAPVQAFTKISTEVIRERGQINDPDYVCVMDESQLSIIDVARGLKEGGLIIINSTQEPGEINLPGNFRVVTVDATSTALETLGVPIVNTAMLGAVCGATGVVRQDSLNRAIETRFGTKAEPNILAAEICYKKCRWGGGK